MQVRSGVLRESLESGSFAEPSTSKSMLIVPDSTSALPFLSDYGRATV